MTFLFQTRNRTQYNDQVTSSYYVGTYLYRNLSNVSDNENWESLSMEIVYMSTFAKAIRLTVASSIPLYSEAGVALTQYFATKDLP